MEAAQRGQARLLERRRRHAHADAAVRGLISERTFGDAKLHVEFMYPAKANSGLYLRGRYEVQIQDDTGKALDALRWAASTASSGPTSTRRSRPTSGRPTTSRCWDSA